MAQYQSFPNHPGDSRTFDKLKALQLPDLKERSFLDVGCNEGFFCGFARYQGAARVIGIDHSMPFITRARQRFPDCEFRHQDWQRLPEGPFDAILLASALHYAEDQAQLLHRLVEMLSPDGVLVLELGIVSSPNSDWIKVKRGIDERYFPTMPKLREVLADYAWKWMGPSVSQDGDPVARHVIHVRRRRPIAYLLLQPPGYGKTSIAKGLFAGAGLPVVSGDHVLGEVAAGRLLAPTALEGAIREGFSPFRLDRTIERIFDAGLGPELVGFLASHAGAGDFALDAYIPFDKHPVVEASLADAGYLPVLMHWERVGLRPLAEPAFSKMAEAFYFSLADNIVSIPVAQDVQAGRMVGAIDELLLEDGNLVVRGWAIAPSNELPKRLQVRVGDELREVLDFQKQTRPDVQRHMALPHALFGFRATLPAPGVSALSDLGDAFAVFGDDHPAAFRIAPAVAAQLAARDG